MPGDLSLRERKKIATRAALSRAALRLATTQGLERLTPEAIAEAVGVSPRTFRNYFDSKEEAIVDAMVQQARETSDALRDRPSDEPIWDAIEHVLRDRMSGLPSEELDILGLMELARNNVTLFAQHLTVFDALQRTMVEVIAERIGADPVHDMYPRLLAAAAGVCVKTALELHVEGRTTATIADLAVDALHQLRAGLPVPDHAGTRPPDQPG